MGKILRTPRTECAICRVNLVSRRVYRRASLKSPLSRPSRCDSVIAARSRIRLRESNFGEWQVGACKRENNGRRHRETRPRGYTDLILFWKSEEKLFIERNSLFIAIPRGANYSSSDTIIWLFMKSGSVTDTNGLSGLSSRSYVSEKKFKHRPFLYNRLLQS